VRSTRTSLVSGAPSCRRKRAAGKTTQRATGTSRRSDPLPPFLTSHPPSRASTELKTSSHFVSPLPHQQDAWQSGTFEPGLIAVRMAVHPNKGKSSPALPGTYYKFLLNKPLVDFLVPSPAPAAARKREPFVLIQFRNLLQHTRAVVPETTTAVNSAAATHTDAPPTSSLASGSETTPERPASPDEVTGLIERLDLAGAASNSGGGDGGGGAAASGGGAACAKCGVHSVVLRRCARCFEVAYCGKQ